VTELVRGPVERDPDVPVHPPGATAQDMAFEEVQLMSVSPPESIVIGPLEPSAFMSTSGAGSMATTFMTNESDADPALLLQVIVYVLEIVRAPVEMEPEVATEPTLLLMTQKSANAELQVRSMLPPELIVIGPSE